MSRRTRYRHDQLVPCRWSIDADLHQALADTAAEHGISVQQMLVTLVERQWAEFVSRRLSDDLRGVTSPPASGAP
jgi:hypothetical protein